MVTLLGECGETPEPGDPEPGEPPEEWWAECAASPLRSHDGYALAAPVFAFVGLVKEGEQSSAPAGPRPTILSFEPPELRGEGDGQLGADVPPETTPGIPASMNRYGTALGSLSQLEADGHPSPVIYVEAAPGVTRLSDSFCGAWESDVRFDDVRLEDPGGSTVRIEVTGHQLQ